MIIPCIDLMGGKVVQLVQGQRKALELDSVEDALEMFSAFPKIHVIDLDAAKGQGQNSGLVKGIIGQKRARVGGGVRSASVAADLVSAGAESVIVGSAAFLRDGSINEPLLAELSGRVGPERVCIAIDCKGGLVTLSGWAATIPLRPEEALAELEPYCGSFLCTYVDREGTMTGTDIDLFKRLRSGTKKTLVAAGGIGDLEEVRELVQLGCEVALGMAIYTGRIDLSDLLRLLEEHRSG
ncbi:MAG TPA: HisA/HisF-related TIM barrel protein [Fimbriimonadaceae bacterium]|nr:HisA/HisF-related TIM barrel protein [Fimbriimonadaceae bacterium]